MHSKTHEGEKCYKCDLCPYASISARHLESHLLIHTDQKPFACDQCEQTFRQKQLLKRHVNLYHNPNYVAPTPKEKTHECPTCSRSFRHKGNLIRHMAVHDPNSNVKEEAMQLKLGRQKRIRAMGLHQSHLLNGGDTEPETDDEMEQDDENVMSMEGEDGQQYVVLEVIQIQNDNENGQGSGVDGDDQNVVMEVEEDFLLPDSKFYRFSFYEDIFV